MGVTAIDAAPTDLPHRMTYLLMDPVSYVGRFLFLSARAARRGRKERRRNEATINRKKRETPPVPAKVTGEVEAHVIALACGQPPDRYNQALNIIGEYVNITGPEESPEDGIELDE